MSTPSEEERSLLPSNIESPEYGSFPEPLNPEQKLKKRTFRYGIFTFGISLLVLIIFVVYNVVKIAPNVEEYVNESTEFEIRNIELDSITTKGVNVKVEGINRINYGEINNDYILNLFKIGGNVLQKATIELEDINLETVISNDEGEDELINLGTIKIPKFDINIKDKDFTNINLIINLRPNTTKVLGLIKRLISNPDEIFKIYFSSDLNLKFFKFVPINGIKLNFETEIFGNQFLNSDNQELEINELEINELEVGGYDFNFEINYLNPFYNKLISFEIPELQWKIFSNDCFNDSIINLFDSVKTDQVKISNTEEYINIKIDAIINELNSKLMEDCDDLTTPMDHLVEGFLNNETIPISVQNYKGSEQYPKFINEILTSLKVPITFKPNFELSKLINSISMNNFKFEFLNGNINEPVINGEIEIVINLPLNSSFNNLEISKIKGSNITELPIQLYHEDSNFGEIKFNNWHNCTNEYIDNLLIIKFNLIQEELIIKNKTIFSKIVNEVLMSGKSNILIDTVLDFYIQSNIGSFEINKININSESELTRGTIFLI